MKLLLNLLFVIAPAIAFGQSTWRSGFITLNDGTSLAGQINDREWNHAPVEIEFKKEGEAPVTYTVNDLISFATNRPCLYESHQVTYDGDKQELKDLPYGKDSKNLRTEKLFVEVKVNAKTGLLFIHDKNDRSHFFIKQDTLIKELLNRRYKNPETGASLSINPQFKQELILITNDCPDIQKNLKHLSYTENALTAVFKSINRCKNNTIEPIWSGAEKEKKHPTLGISVQVFRISSAYLSYYSSKATSPNFAAGLFLEVYSKKKPNRVSLYNELSYKVINPQEGNYDRGVSLYFPNNKAEVECQKLKLTNVMRFSNPNKSGGSSYFGIGVNNGYRFNTLIGGRSEGIYPFKDDYSSGVEVGLTSMVGQTFILFKSVKLSTELRYEYEYGISHSYSFHNLGLSLQFSLYK